MHIKNTQKHENIRRAEHKMDKMSRESKVHESFIHESSMVDDVVNHLEEILKGKKEEKGKTPVITKNISDFSYLVFQRSQSSPGKRSKSFRKTIPEANLNRMTFMRQVDISDEERTKVRKERILIAKNFRKLV